MKKWEEQTSCGWTENKEMIRIKNKRHCMICYMEIVEARIVCKDIEIYNNKDADIN